MICRLLSILVFIGIVFCSSAQIVTDINPSNSGCGNSISGFLPVRYGDWGAEYGWSASVYNKTFLGSVDTEINKVLYFTDCGSCSFNSATNQKVYLGHIINSQFTNSSRPDLDTDITDLTLVFSGIINWETGKWNEIVFDTPYIYDANKNLVIYISNEHGGPLGPSFLCDQPVGIVDAFGATGTAYSKYRNNSSVLPVSGYTSNQAPIIKIGHTPISLLNSFKPVLKTQGINQKQVTFDLNFSAEDFETVILEYGTEKLMYTQKVRVMESNMVSVDLQNNGLYYFRVKLTDETGKIIYSEPVSYFYDFEELNLVSTLVKQNEILQFYNLKFDANYSLTIINQNGMIVSQSSEINQYRINLPVGFYFYKVLENDQPYTGRFVVF